MTYELHTESGVIAGTLDELKKESLTVEGPWRLYCLIESSMNRIKISNYRHLTVQEYKDIYKLCQQGWGRQSIGLKYNLGQQSINKIRRDELKIMDKPVYR